MTIHRQLGDKARTLTRTRDREGREDREEDLRGIHQGILYFLFFLYLLCFPPIFFSFPPYLAY